MNKGLKNPVRRMQINMLIRHPFQDYNFWILNPVFVKTTARRASSGLQKRDTGFGKGENPNSFEGSPKTLVVNLDE